MNLWYMASDEVRGIPITRYVASWYIAGGKHSPVQVREWLKSLIINDEHLNEDEVALLFECILNGKLELEESVKRFIG